MNAERGKRSIEDTVKTFGRLRVGRVYAIWPRTNTASGPAGVFKITGLFLDIYGQPAFQIIDGGLETAWGIDYYNFKRIRL